MIQPDCVLRSLVEAPRDIVSPPVATTQFHLADDAPWTDVGASPLMMMSRQAVLYVISDEPPGEPPLDGFRLEPRVTQMIGIPSRVWAATATTGGADLIVAGPVR